MLKILKKLFPSPFIDEYYQRIGEKFTQSESLLKDISNSLSQRNINEYYQKIGEKLATLPIYTEPLLKELSKFLSQRLNKTEIKEIKKKIDDSLGKDNKRELNLYI
jgi:hypothetical protein